MPAHASLARPYAERMRRPAQPLRAPPTPASAEHYRREREPCSREYGEELTRVSGDIDDPVAKLRYLRGAIENEDAARVERVPYAPARRALFRLRSLEALDAVTTNPQERAAVARDTLQARQRARRVVVGTIAGVALLVPALLAGLALQFDAPPQRTAAAQRQLEQAPPPALPVSAPADTVVAESLPEEILGLAPATIWMADRGPGWELYSNGLRIETTYATAGEPRRYRIHHRDKGLQPAIYTRPVGILFHTSESDLWPLEPDYERQLRRSASSLVRYVQRERAYNYLIDRFGRVYRIVDDDTRAHHAGHSVWANDEEVFLDLNSAFLGVSFESRWDGGKVLPITRAQLIAGRNLTNYLRQRYAIAPEMCVTHGLTSVSPRQHLIGYHRDWARGFPFAAFGLPDLYAQPPPSVALFGFGRDEEFRRAVGELWPGLVVAERQLAEQAQQRAIPLEQLRNERRALYQQWSRQAPAGEAVANELESQRISDKRG